MKQERRDIGGCVLVAKYSPSGKQVALAGGEKTWGNWGFVYIYDVKTLTKQYEREHPFKITCLDWSPDSERLAYGGSEGIAFVWNPRTDTVLSYREHSPELISLPTVSNPIRREIYDVAWFADAQQVTSAGQDGCVRIWHALSGRTAQVTYSEIIGDKFTYAPGGIIAIMSGIKTRSFSSRYAHAEVFDVKEEQVLFSLLHEVPYASSFAWAPQPLCLALVKGEQIQIWDLQLGRQICNMFYRPYQSSSLYEAQPSSLAWSPDGKCLACCVRTSRNDFYGSYGRDRYQAVVEIRSVTTGMTLHAYTVTDPYCLDWAPHEDQLVVGEGNGFEMLPIQLDNPEVSQA